MAQSIRIERLLFTQRSLKRYLSLPQLMQLVDDGVPFLEPIELHRNDAGQIVINNGHHRVMAIWLSGRDDLHDNEFILLDMEQCRSPFGDVHRLLRALPTAQRAFVDRQNRRTTGGVAA
jgi:hypothetical protein